MANTLPGMTASTTTTTFKLEGMHCGACVKRLESALQPFAETVRVSLNPPRAELINRKADASIDVLRHAVASAGNYRLGDVVQSAAPPVAGGTALSAAVEDDTRSWLQTYWPLLVIVSYIAVVSFGGSASSGETMFAGWMMNFMAGFFLVFSAFKFLDIRGFADAYASYDLLAKRWHGYGFIYPFIELALGLAFLFRVAPTATLIATILIMGFSSLGVLDAVRSKRRIQCACLGTTLNLPMSTITLVEDLGMVAMAAVMLAL